MHKLLIYMIIFSLLLVSCEEYYTPELDAVSGLLVVESQLTNEQSINFVKLSIARGFYDTKQATPVVGAKVELIEVGGSTFRATETGTGYFSFAKIPVYGKRYQLRVSYDGEVYESSAETMPPLPSLDTIYTNPKIEQTYLTDGYGEPYLVKSPGREILIDAPITNSLQYYRFSWRAIIQWMYIPSPLDGSTPRNYYGWISYRDRGTFNIAGPKQFSMSDEVKSQPILFLKYNSIAYLDSLAEIPMGWIVQIDQYGIPKTSYDFHEKLNKQFTAEGSLFDPVLTQVTGNLHCKSDPSKIVLGLFNLNSYRQHRFFLDIGNSDRSKVILRRLYRYPDISERDYVRDNPPDFWENFY